MSTGLKSDTQIVYRERVLPSVWSFLPGTLIIPSLALTFAPFSWVGGLLAGIVSYGLVLVLMVASAPVIEVSGTTLRVANATISRKHLGAATTIEETEARTRAIRTELNALAYLRLQASVKPLLKIEITDERDPAPYWLFSTRNPKAILVALGK